MQHILSLSYGKDSLACLGAIEELGWPLDRIVHAEIWATDTIPADLPPMVEFKAKADKIIKERWGIEVEHYRASATYEQILYKKVLPSTLEKRKASPNWVNRGIADIYGFPSRKGPWCNSMLKMEAVKKAGKAREGQITYIGIAADEPSRFHNLTDTKKSPLVELGWGEAYCRQWCGENGLLSPIYAMATRGGCWFCHNQPVNQLRLLRKNYPDLWQLMLKWDNDSPVTFHADGHTVHDFDRRFALEDEGFIVPGESFRWKMLDEPLNTRLF